MSPKDLERFKNTDSFSTVRLNPQERHMLATLVKMTSVPEEFHERLRDAMNRMEAQPVAREVAEIFMKTKDLSDTSEAAHDLYLWYMMWAGKEDSIPSLQG